MPRPRSISALSPTAAPVASAGGQAASPRKARFGAGSRFGFRRPKRTPPRPSARRVNAHEMVSRPSPPRCPGPRPRFGSSRASSQCERHAPGSGRRLEWGTTSLTTVMAHFPHRAMGHPLSASAPRRMTRPHTARHGTSVLFTSTGTAESGTVAASPGEEISRDAAVINARYPSTRAEPSAAAGPRRAGRLTGLYFPRTTGPCTAAPRGTGDISPASPAAVWLRPSLLSSSFMSSSPRG